MKKIIKNILFMAILVMGSAVIATAQSKPPPKPKPPVIKPKPKPKPKPSPNNSHVAYANFRAIIEQ